MELCFIIYKWTSLKSEKYMKNLLQKSKKKKFIGRNLHKYFVFHGTKKFKYFDIFRLNANFYPFMFGDM